MVVLSGALLLTSQAVGISDMVTHRSEMHQNARVAINMMARDLSLAGTGWIPDLLTPLREKPLQSVKSRDFPARI